MDDARVICSLSNCQIEISEQDREISVLRHQLQRKQKELVDSERKVSVCVCVCVCVCVRERERQTDRQTEMETEKEIDKDCVLYILVCQMLKCLTEMRKSSHKL